MNNKNYKEFQAYLKDLRERGLEEEADTLERYRVAVISSLLALHPIRMSQYIIPGKPMLDDEVYQSVLDACKEINKALGIESSPFFTLEELMSSQ